MGIECLEEVTGGFKAAPWQADTLFSIGDRIIVIELQRSYQHLRDYLRRQERYAKAGVESYWLTRAITYKTVVSACSKLRFKRDFHNTYPPEGHFGPLLQELPIAYLEIGDNARILGAGCLSASVESWLLSVIDRSFQYAEDGNWKIRSVM